MEEAAGVRTVMQQSFIGKQQQSSAMNRVSLPDEMSRRAKQKLVTVRGD
jgi:hypothetical protein